MTPQHLVAIQAISSVVVAVSVLALLRRSNRTTSPPDLLASRSDLDSVSHSEITPAPSDPPSNHSSQRMKARGVIRLLIALAVLVSAARFGSLDEPVGLGVLVGGIALYVGWSFWASHWSDRTELIRRLGGLILFAATAALVTQITAANQDLQARILTVFALVATGGFWLWATEMYDIGSRANLGAALLGGALIASTIFYIEDASQTRSQQHDVRFTVGLHRDLSAADLVEEDLSNAHLFEKKFRDADLGGANLTEAYLVEADLTGAWLNDAILVNANLADASFENAELLRADLSNTLMESVSFEGSDLTDAKLVGVEAIEFPEGNNFQSTNLIRADLSESRLQESNFASADLTGATLRGANLARANLSAADLTDAKLEETQLNHTNLRGVDLSTTDLTSTELTDSVADTETMWPQGFDPAAASVYVLRPRADLRKVDLSGQDLSAIDLSEADLRGTDLSGTDLSAAQLVKTNLRGVQLYGAAAIENSILTDADLRGAFLDGMNLANVNLAGARLQGSSLLGSDLRKARLAGTQLRGAKASRDTRWPRGFNPRAAGVQLVKIEERGD
jgi:uncharacterized protein YjbI with pentapeptide repeats